MSLDEKILRVLQQYDVFGHTVGPAASRMAALAELTEGLAALVPTSPDLGTPEEEFAHAVGRLVQRLEDGMVLKWLVVIDSMDPEGHRGLWCQASPDQHAHESLGMLAFTEELVRAKIQRDDQDGD